MHHSSDNDNEMLERLREQLEKTRGLRTGPTGKFPEGKLTPNDEGEIKIAIAAVDNKVVIDFGKPIAWIGFSPAQARDIAESLKKHADAAEGK